MNDYRRCMDHWDAVFSDCSQDVPSSPRTGNDSLDEAIAWLCEGSKRVFDFGCASGTLLFYCALNGTSEHTGVDFSIPAITCARIRASKMPAGTFAFSHGSLEQVAKFKDSSFDGMILSNILDNLYPDDAVALLRESARVLKHGGKVLLKLNPYLTQEQIRDWNIRIISGDLLDDGLLLWNTTTAKWRDLLSPLFEIEREGEVFYPEHDQTNRLFLLRKK